MQQNEKCVLLTHKTTIKLLKESFSIKTFKFHFSHIETNLVATNQIHTHTHTYTFSLHLQQQLHCTTTHDICKLMGCSISSMSLAVIWRHEILQCCMNWFASSSTILCTPPPYHTENVTICGSWCENKKNYIFTWCKTVM